MEIGNIYHKVGKQIDMRKLNRTINWRLNTAKEQKEMAKKFFKYTTRIYQCPICRSKNFTQFVELYRYIYYKCKKCEHLFCNRYPIRSKIRQLYRRSSKKTLIQNQIYLGEENFNNRLSNIALPKVNFINSFIPVNGLWIDIGCGGGEILYAARKSGWKVKGFEVDPNEALFARSKKLDIIQDYLDTNSVEKYQSDLNRAKIISFFNILEHIPNPMGLLDAIVKKISLNSYIIIEVPRYPSLSVLNNIVFPELVCRYLYPPEHLHIFTEQSINYLLKKLRLGIKASWNFGQDFQDLVNCLAVKLGDDNNYIIKALYKISNKVQNLIDQQGLSDTLIVVARKY